MPHATPPPPTGLRLHQRPPSDGVGLGKHIVWGFSVPCDTAGPTLSRRLWSTASRAGFALSLRLSAGGGGTEELPEISHMFVFCDLVLLVLSVFIHFLNQSPYLGQDRGCIDGETDS